MDVVAAAADRAPAATLAVITAIVSAAVAVAMAYARFAASWIPQGPLRLAAFIPVVLLLLLVPFAFPSSMILRGTAAFFLSWLGVFKILLLAFGQGPLAATMPLPAFICSASLPVKLQSAPASPAAAPPPSSATSLKLVVLPVLVLVMGNFFRFKGRMDHRLFLVVNFLTVYVCLETLLAFAAAVVRGVLGMEMERQVNRPYIASSLRDFWGRRWNLMVSAILRPSVYLPVRARLGEFSGVLATFLVSGLMHELIFYYLIRWVPTGEMTAFFVLHGVCSAAEGWYARHGGWWRPPRSLATPLTLAFIAATGFTLFFPPIIRAGFDDLIFTEYTALMAGLEAASTGLLAAVGVGTPPRSVRD